MEPLTLTELARRVAERWRVVAVGALLGVVVGLTVQLALPTRYQAVTVVHVDAAEPDRVDMVAERATAASRRVMAEASAALGGDLLPERLEASVTVRVVKGSRVLEVRRSTGDAREAARGADAVAQAYLAVRAVDSADDPRAPTGAVLDPARVPRSAIGPTPPLAGVGGLTLGLLIAVPCAARPRGGR